MKQMNADNFRYGNGNLGGVATVGPLGLPPTMPMLQLRWQPVPFPGEGVGERRVGATFGHVNSTKKTTITISRENFSGAALANLEFVVTGAAAKVPWDGALSASADASASTIVELMDLLNEIVGLNVEVLNAPYSLDINSATALADVAEVDIPYGVGPETVLKTMFGVNSVTKKSYMRVGLPEVFDAGHFTPVKVEGTCAGTVTTSKLSIYRDNYAEQGETVEYVIKDEILTVARKVYIGADSNVSAAMLQSVRGSVILEVSGGSSVLSAMDFRFQLINDQLGS